MASFWDERAARYESGASGSWHASIAGALIDAASPQRGERLRHSCAWPRCSPPAVAQP